MKSKHINRGSLTAAGYQQYKADSPASNNVGYQRCIKNAVGDKLYFINFRLCSYNGELATTSVDARLYLAEDNKVTGTFGIETELQVTEEATISDVEQFYADTYERLGCVPDLHNN